MKVKTLEEWTSINMNTLENNTGLLNRAVDKIKRQQDASFLVKKVLSEAH